MSLPYFPLYAKDFEAKTSHLSIEEDGVYNRLLRLCWMTPGCTIPDDDRWIMRRIRVDEDTYNRVVLVVIDEFFKRENGRVSNAKLLEIYMQSNEAHKKRVSAGSKGGKCKSLKTNKIASSNATSMLKQPEPEPYNIDSSFHSESNNSLSLRSRESELDKKKYELKIAFDEFCRNASESGLPVPRKMTEARKRKMAARIREHGLDTWMEACQKMADSKFCHGENNRGWRADFDFICDKDNFIRLVEGRYDNRKQGHEPPKTIGVAIQELAKKEGILPDENFINEIYGYETGCLEAGDTARENCGNVVIDGVTVKEVN